MTRYDVDVAVIGGGSAGLVAAAGCAALGARTVLIERDRLGGECTWTGCIPSKTLLRFARQAEQARQLGGNGVDAGEVRVDFGEVMDAVRATRQRIYAERESPVYLKRLGLRVFKGRARFQDDHTLMVSGAPGERPLSFRSAIIATGGRASAPPVQGLDQVRHYTNETIFELTEQPRHLLVLGCGPTGLELAQAFARLGSQVTAVAHSSCILPADDEQAANIVQPRLEAEGIEFRLGQTLKRAYRQNGLTFFVVGPDEGPTDAVEADALLIATGRRPSVHGLDLERAGVEYSGEGIQVDRACRTSARHIFAAGDVTTELNFTHMAEHMAMTAAANAIARLPVLSYERGVIPRVTFTDPEVAHVGKTRGDLNAAGERYDVIEFPYSKIDRAFIEEDEGMILVYYARLGRILGVTIVGRHAGEMIAEYALAMKHGIRLRQIAGTVHAYPTLSRGVRRSADQFSLRLLKPWMVRLVKLVYGYRGPIPGFIGTREVI